MNQKLLSGLTAALLISSFGLAPSSYADRSKPAEPQSRVDASESGIVSSTTTSRRPIAATSPASSETALDSVANSIDLTEATHHSDEEAASKVSSSTTSEAAATEINPNPQPTEVVKVGEYQSQVRSNATVATIQPHLLQGKSAATVYIRNIPVLTFLGETPTAEATSATEPYAEVKVASVQLSSAQARNADTLVAAQTSGPLYHSRKMGAAAFAPDSNQTSARSVHSNPVGADTDAANSRDPIWRATTAAARLNQLYQDNVSADEIKISWDQDRKQYVIRADETEIIVLDTDTVLPDTVENEPGDLLQATNRIRRQMGGAEPLSNIEDDPNGVRQVSLGRLNLRVTGYASWYGPGFDGNYSASGEVFNQDALTAAHPSLPFGTQVRVTNMDNGQSVVVRINDRGPYAHDRVIDLSAGAARIIGLIQSGVAPVSLEVVGAAQAVN